MFQPFSRRRLLWTSSGLAAAVLAARRFPELFRSKFTYSQETAAMGPQKKAEQLGITFEKQTPGYLNKCVRSGNQLITSGHTSKIKGKLGADLQSEQGYAAARECAVEILRSVWNTHGTLDGLKVLKVLGCVNGTPEFIEQPAVVNGCSDLFHEIFGKETDGWHARSALGFASLPNGVAVEVEAIFEVKS